MGMWKKALILCGFFAFLPFVLFAADVHIGEDFFLKGSEKTTDDVYTVGSSTLFSGRVGGDATALGGTVLGNGDIAGDALFVGKRLTLRGTTTDDARLLGGRVFLEGRVGDDAVLLGGTVAVLPSASVGGDLYAVGDEVAVEGKVAGNARIAAREARIAGTVRGNVEVWGDVAVGSSASIGGDFIYHAKHEITISPGATLSGRVLFVREGAGGRVFPFKRDLLSGFFSLQLLMQLLLGFLLLFLMRERLEETLADMLSCFWPRVLRGALLLVLLPIAGVLLMGSIIGIPVALLLFAFLIMGGIVGTAVSGVMVGLFLEKTVFKRPLFPVTYRPVLLGILLLSLISVLPYVGLVANAMLLLAAFGSLGTISYRHFRMP